LSFPEWGRNWDALYDWLSRLHWLEPTSVIIIHDGLPTLSADDLRIYLSILRDVESDWASRTGHKLVAVFATDDAQRIQDIERAAHEPT
jgi:hypothetical protein